MALWRRNIISLSLLYRLDELRIRFRFPALRNIFLFSATIPAFPQSPILAATRPGVKWSRCKSYNLTATTAFFRSVWSYNSTTHTTYDLRGDNVRDYVCYIDTTHFYFTIIAVNDISRNLTLLLLRKWNLFIFCSFLCLSFKISLSLPSLFVWYPTNFIPLPVFFITCATIWKILARILPPTRNMSSSNLGSDPVYIDWFCRDGILKYAIPDSLSLLSNSLFTVSKALGTIRSELLTSVRKKLKKLLHKCRPVH